MRGRKPEATVVKILSGSKHVREDLENEPIPQGDLETPPAHFTERQRQIWQDALDNAPRGLLRRLDASMLAIWVVACETHEKAADAVSKHGLIVKSPVQGAPMQNPYLPILNRQAEIMLRTAAEMGFSPTSRSRISAGDGAKRETNRFSRNASRKRRA